MTVAVVVAVTVAVVVEVRPARIVLDRGRPVTERAPAWGYGGWRERLVLLKRPRCDTDGVRSGSDDERKVGFTKKTARRHRRVGGRAVTVTAMLHRQRYTVIEKGRD